MRGAADGDLAAFDQSDTSAAGFDVNVGATAQQRLDLAANDFDAHRAGDGDGVAFDDSDGIADVLVIFTQCRRRERRLRKGVACGKRQKRRRTKKCQRRQKAGAARSEALGQK